MTSETPAITGSRSTVPDVLLVIANGSVTSSAVTAYEPVVALVHVTVTMALLIAPPAFDTEATNWVVPGITGNDESSIEAAPVLARLNVIPLCTTVSGAHVGAPMVVAWRVNVAPAGSRTEALAIGVAAIESTNGSPTTETEVSE
jgi:Sec-independent protein secretion pathway component TatC